MPTDQTTKKTNPLIPLVIIIGLIFLLFSFSRLNKNKTALNPQLQPTPAASNSADFDQQNRLDASGATITTEQNTESIQITLFGRNSCPHCQVVDAYLEKEPQVKSKLTKKWIDDGKNDRNEQKELTKAAADCGIPEKELGVPLLHVQGKNAPTTPADRCRVGDTPIIDFLSTNLK